MVPPFSVTRKVPSGRNASDQGEVNRSVTICVWNGAEAGGAGASVCPVNAGLGSGDCATSVPRATIMRISVTLIYALLCGGVYHWSRIHHVRSAYLREDTLCGRESLPYAPRSVWPALSPVPTNLMTSSIRRFAQTTFGS